MKTLLVIACTLCMAYTVSASKPRQVPRPRQAPEVIDDTKLPSCGKKNCDCGCKDGDPCRCAAPATKSCPCSPACTCGCNQGGPCGCGEQKVFVQRPATFAGDTSLFRATVPAPPPPLPAFVPTAPAPAPSFVPYNFQPVAPPVSFMRPVVPAARGGNC